MNIIKVNPDKALVWTQIDDPVLDESDVLIQVSAAAVNRADILQREGKYPPPPGAPDWMGLEVSGVVVRVGNNASCSVTGRPWKPGDRVCALLPGGGYAQYVTAPAQLLLPVPGTITMEEAASLPEVFCTAYLNLVIEADLKAGETVLIHAGASGVGIAAIQLAKLLGARVITTVRGENKAQAVRALGADIVVDATVDDLTAVLECCESEGRPVNVALDCVGGAQLGDHLCKMAQGGRWILIATLGGDHAQISLRPLLKRGVRLLGSTLRSRSVQVKSEIIKQLYERVWPELAARRIVPVVHGVFPITQAEQAHAVLQRRENIGKVVLQVGDC